MNKILDLNEAYKLSDKELKEYYSKLYAHIRLIADEYERRLSNKFSK